MVTLRSEEQLLGKRWSMDFVHDATLDGRAFRVLTVVDQWSRWSPILEVAQSMSGRQVAEALDRAIALHGKPRLYSDNLDEKGATIWMRSWVSRQTHHDGRFARPQACCLAICRAATPLRWF